MSLRLSIRDVVLWLGPLIAIIIFCLPLPDGLRVSSWYLIALMSWMVVWWLSEAIPISATALLPIPLMPFLGIADLTTVLSHYVHPLVLLFLGGFLLAAAMQKSGLHKRIALKIFKHGNARILLSKDRAVQ